MKARDFGCAVLLATTWLLLGGCASTDIGSTEKSDSGAPRKGKWVYVDPPTGSYIRRRVWVDENGNVSDPSSAARTQSPEILRQWQNSGNLGGSGRPGGQ